MPVMPQQRKTETRRIAPCQVPVADDYSGSCKESCVTPVTKRHDETHPETRATLHRLHPLCPFVRESGGGVGVQIVQIVQMVQMVQSVSVIEVPQIPRGQMYKGKICGLSNFYVSSCHRRPRCFPGLGRNCAPVAMSCCKRLGSDIFADKRRWEKLTRPRRGTATPIQRQVPATERIGMRLGSLGNPECPQNLVERSLSYRTSRHRSAGRPNVTAALQEDILCIWLRAVQTLRAR